MLKVGSNGEVVRLSDVARIELGASDYTLRGQLDHYNTAIVGVFQAPGANALATRDAVMAKMDEIAAQFPPGVSYRSDYDATVFVRESISAVVHTLFEAIALVVLVVIVFLANLARLDHSIDRRAGVGCRHLRGSLSAQLFHQHALAVRPGARDRDRRR